MSARAIQGIASLGERILKFPSVGGAFIIGWFFAWLFLLAAIPSAGARAPSASERAQSFVSENPPVSWIEAPLEIDSFDQASKAGARARLGARALRVPFGRLGQAPLERPIGGEASDRAPEGAPGEWSRVSLSAYASGGALDGLMAQRKAAGEASGTPVARLGVAVQAAPEDYKVQGSTVWLRRPAGSEISLSLWSLSAQGAGWSAKPAPFLPSCESELFYCVALLSVEPAAAPPTEPGLSWPLRGFLLCFFAPLALWLYKTRARRHCRALAAIVSPALAAALFPLSAPDQELAELLLPSGAPNPPDSA